MYDSDQRIRRQGSQVACQPGEFCPAGPRNPPRYSRLLYLYRHIISTRSPCLPPHLAHTCSDRESKRSRDEPAPFGLWKKYYASVSATATAVSPSPCPSVSAAGAGRRSWGGG